MQPIAMELGYVCNLLHRANAGDLHIPDGVTEAVDDDHADDDDAIEDGETNKARPSKSGAN